MSYDDIEESTDDGYAVELYKFVGTFNTYRYTSFARAVTFESQVYTPIAGLTRKNLRLTSVGGSSTGELEIQMPYDDPLALEYTFTDIPPDLTLTIYRGHLSDVDEAYRVIWTGAAGSWTVKGRIASMRIPSTFSTALEQSVPAQRWQGPCGHLLYDARCGISRIPYRVQTTAVGMIANSLSVLSLPWVGTVGNGGEVVNLATGERRTIISHLGNVVKLKVAFSRLTVGDNLELFQGCDHSAATCRDKFANLDNYGGMNLIPSLNPFGSTIR